MVLAACTWTQSAWAQILRAESDPYQRFGETNLTRYRVGASITARRGPVQNIVAMVAVPLECSEQDVQIIQTDASADVHYDYRLLSRGGARQLVLEIPYLPPGEEAHAIVTFEVRTRTILPPNDVTQLRIPKSPSRDLKPYLGKSPYIETRHPKIKKALREALASLEDAEPVTEVDTEGSEVGAEQPPLTARQLPTSPDKINDWQRVEAIYDFVQNSIEYLQGPDKSAVKTLQDGVGDCQNISALFVALCRTHKIPARIVWVHEHNYAEFCLVDSEGAPHWFPCESSGRRAFGEMPLARTILQKGDNFRVPERPKERLRYASNYMVAEALGSSRPKVRYIQEQL